MSRETLIIAELRARGLLKLAEEVALRHHVMLETMLRKSKSPPFVHARHELWARVYKVLPSYPQIAIMFDHDHTTVRDGVLRYLARENGKRDI